MWEEGERRGCWDGMWAAEAAAGFGLLAAAPLLLLMLLLLCVCLTLIPCDGFLNGKKVFRSFQNEEVRDRTVWPRSSLCSPTCNAHLNEFRPPRALWTVSAGEEGVIASFW